MENYYISYYDWREEGAGRRSEWKMAKSRANILRYVATRVHRRKIESVLFHDSDDGVYVSVHYR